MKVEVHIERLVLHDFEPGDRHRIGAAVERELGRLLAERGVPPALVRGGDLGRLDAGSFAAPRGARPRAVGAEVARSVHKRLDR